MLSNISFTFLDEIDGAPAPTINYLVNLLSGKAAGNKKKKAAAELLSRPIVSTVFPLLFSKYVQR